VRLLFGWWSSYSPHPTGSVQPSYVYVFCDCSPPEPLVLVLKLVDRALGVPAGTSGSAGMLWRQHQSEKFSEQQLAWG